MKWLKDTIRAHRIIKRLRKEAKDSQYWDISELKEAKRRYETFLLNHDRYIKELSEAEKEIQENRKRINELLEIKDKYIKLLAAIRINNK